jgi:hypothetical protein
MPNHMKKVAHFAPEFILKEHEKSNINSYSHTNCQVAETKATTKVLSNCFESPSRKNFKILPPSKK